MKPKRKTTLKKKVKEKMYKYKLVAKKGNKIVATKNVNAKGVNYAKKKAREFMKNHSLKGNRVLIYPIKK